VTQENGADAPGESPVADDDARGADASALVGTTFAGKYDIEALVGEGGMARVYRARQPVLDREVALKVLEPPAGDLERAAFDRMFLREAATAAQLKSPHSITLYDFGQADDGTPFLIMEFLEGRPLDQVLTEDAPLPARRAVHIAVQACRSLREAHEKGLVHRDLKPANVMLVDRNNDPDFVKVLDFGIAKNSATGGEDDEASLAGVFIGSPRYASPEQLQRRPDVDHRADIYACGLLMYAMLVGDPPFDGTPRELLHKHLLEPPQPMDELKIDVPAELAAVVYRCLEKDPARRYGDMTELIRALGGVTFVGDEQDAPITQADMADFAAEIELDETDDALMALRREQERRRQQQLAEELPEDEEPTDKHPAGGAGAVELEGSSTVDLERPGRAIWPWLVAGVVVLGLLAVVAVIGGAKLLAGRGAGTPAVDPGTESPAAEAAPEGAGPEGAAPEAAEPGDASDVVVEDAVEVGAAGETGAGTRTGAGTETETERMAAPTEVETETETETETEAETETETETERMAAPTETEAETGSEAETETEAETESPTDAPQIEGYKDDPY